MSLRSLRSWPHWGAVALSAIYGLVVGFLVGLLFAALSGGSLNETLAENARLRAELNETLAENARLRAEGADRESRIAEVISAARQVAAENDQLRTAQAAAFEEFCDQAARDARKQELPEAADPVDRPEGSLFWRVVNGVKTTETFYMDVPKWKLSWEVWETDERTDYGKAFAMATVFREDGELVQLVSGEGADTSVIRADPGQFYLTLIVTGGTIDFRVERSDP